MNDANTLHPFTSAWDAPRPRRGRKGFAIAVAAILAAHGLLVFNLYKSTFDPHYAPPADEPPIVATVVHPEPSPPPPPPPSSPKNAAQKARPRQAQSLPTDVVQPPPIPLPPPPIDNELTSPQPANSQTPPLAAEVKPRVLTNPQFDRQPNSDDLAQYYPERANRLGKEGAAAIRCTVSAKGALMGCVVTSEEPQGFGFGDAALKLAKLFKLKPATADGVAVDGGLFSTKIAFKLPD